MVAKKRAVGSRLNIHLTTIISVSASICNSHLGLNLCTTSCPPLILF